MRAAFSFGLVSLFFGSLPATGQVCRPHWDPVQAVGNPGMPAEVRSLARLSDRRNLHPLPSI